MASYKGVTITPGTDAEIQKQVQTINQANTGGSLSVPENLPITNQANTINSSNLAPVSQIKYTLPKNVPVYDVSKLNVSPQLEMTQPETKAQSLTEQLQSLNEGLLGESSYRAKQEKNLDIQEKMTAQKDLESRLRVLQNEAAAIPLQLMKDASKEGVTQYQLGVQETSRLRDNAIASLATASQLEASRGNLTTALELVDRAVAQRYDPIREEINAKTANLDLILKSPEYTVAEKNRAQQQLDIQNERKRQLDEEKDNQTEIYKIAVQAATNGADAMTLRNIQNSKTKEEAVQQASGYFVNPLDTQEQGLRIQKLKQDLSDSGLLKTDVVEVNGKKLLINTQTGETIKEIGGGDNPSDVLQLAVDSENINTLSSLKDSKGLTGTVGSYGVSRWTPFSPDKAERADFIAGVEQIRSQLNLDKLISAKAQGATFGALSNQELQVLANAATKIGSWAKKDKDGNVIAYVTSEKNFLKEVDKINNFAKLDFILKGGNPESVGVKIMKDGRYLTQNSDGSYE